MESGVSERDLRLLRYLANNCRVNLRKVARLLGVSHTAVRKRLSRLLDGGYVSLTASLDLERMGFRLALLFLEVASDEDLEMLLRKYRDCPRIVSICKILGEYNVVALIYAENEKVMDSILGSCMMRTAEGIRKSLVVPVSRVLRGGWYAVEVPLRSRDVAPCGADCLNCGRYRRGECPGCPSVKWYRGPFSVGGD